ncbi:BrnT family toxin [Lichenibacterium dinghuense]|uniref:BrnT family toxin n=1 Tax=Lichenibacterium dinghuense TaxID=2895977 RepID=UPI001F3BEE33|nr:BrnT family toxin [Lichenibacterium sp. 6Y81]
MMIVFDEPKRLSNLRKHGLDMDGFADGFDFRTARQFEAYTSRTGRTRFALIGWMGGELVVVAIVSPLGSEALSLVSLRPASLTERTLHGFA